MSQLKKYSEAQLLAVKEALNAWICNVLANLEEENFTTALLLQEQLFESKASATLFRFHMIQMKC
eukprot:4673870-Ditylum_brightwellii.AAC.1